jgi:hypothetical protein
MLCNNFVHIHQILKFRTFVNANLKNFLQHLGLFEFKKFQSQNKEEMANDKRFNIAVTRSEINENLKKSCYIHRRTINFMPIVAHHSKGSNLKVFVPGVHHVLNEVNVEDDAAAAHEEVRANLGSIS